MKKRNLTLGLTICSLLGLSACSSLDDGLNTEQAKAEGTLMLKLSSGTQFGETRAVNEESYKNTDNYTVQVFDKDQNEKLNCKGSELAYHMPLKLSIGSYTVKASYGTKDKASTTGFYVEGTAEGTIKADGSEEVRVVCTPTCGKVSVVFDSNMPTFFSDYSVVFDQIKVLGDGGNVSWAKDQVDPWYIELDEAGETIRFTVITATKDDYETDYNGDGVKTETDMKSGTFKLERNKAYKLHVSPKYTATGNGQLGISITIDERTNDIEIPIEVPITWI